MGYLWMATLEDYFQAVQLAQANGKKEGENFEEEFLMIMQAKGKAPLAETEMTQEQLINTLLDKGINIKHIRSKKGDNDGKA